MAAGDLCVLADVKFWLGIATGVTTEDTQISRLISATSYDFLREIARPDFTPNAAYTENREGDGADRIILRHWPLNSITSVQIGITVLAGSDYFIDTDLDPERRWELYLKSPKVFTDGAALIIVYNAGYAAVPGDVSQATIEWVALRHRSRSSIGQASKHLVQGESIQTPEIDIPASTKRVIERYRRFDPLRTPPERTPEMAGAKPAR